MRTHPPVVDAPVSPPALSVVLVTAGGFGNIRRTVRHLRAQTVQSRLELIVVASSEAAIVDRQPHETAGFQRVVVVPAGPIDNVDTSAAAGIRRATAPVVAIIEDHAYPEPEWAAALVEAHRDSHAAIGPAVLNANPSSLLSWTNMLLAYGRWGEDAPPGEIDDIARHNSSFKREALLAYGDDLERLLGREGGLLQDLRAKGHRLLLQPAARIAHVNPSRLVSTADLRFNAGRLYGASRAARNRWSMPKRLLYAAAGPLIPFVRFRRLRKDLFGAGQRRALVPRVYPALLLGLAFDGAGQMAGYLFGAGRSPDKLAVFEMDRLQHLTARDRQAIDEAGRGIAPAS
jgi:Glycosyl transferase family 2